MKRFVQKFWKFIMVIAILVVIGGIWWSKRAKQQTASSIKTSSVTRQTFIKTISSSGKTKADKSVSLKFQTSGKLAWVGVKEGDTVAPFQAIATLDSREVQKNLEKTLRDYDKERNDFEETWRVDYSGKKPEQALTDTVKRILEKNQWDLERAILDVELKHLSVEYSRLVTPIGGIVTHLDTPVAGVNITPATAVFEISDPKSLIFEANIDEVDIEGLTMDQHAIIRLDAYPESTFSGKISYIAYTSEPSSSGATVFSVKITFDNPEILRIGLNGDVTIEVERQDNALTVPTEALRDDKDGAYVYKKEGGVFIKTRVKTGLKNDNDIVIDSGLAEGDIVVTKGFGNIPKTNKPIILQYLRAPASLAIDSRN